MPRKNLRDVIQQVVGPPDNQQERLEIASWICGFVDGEGCFSVSIIRNATTSSGWQVFPEFVVTQGEKSRAALELIKNFFSCGQIHINRRHDNHREALLRYCVRSQKELRERIIPFFEKYSLRTEKAKDFQKFAEILELMKNGIHLVKDGREHIAHMIQTMNRKVPSRFLESSETICRTPQSVGKI